MAEAPSPPIVVRDLSEASRRGIELAKAAGGHRSREAFLRDYLDRVFGPDSATTATSMRFYTVLTEILSLGEACFAFKERPTIARIAQACSLESTAPLDAAYRGEVPVTFALGDAICDQFGIRRDWLNNGEGERYRQVPRYHEPHELLAGMYRDGIPYKRLRFVMGASPRGEAAVYGETSDYIYELLLRGIPIHSDIGGTGERYLMDFGYLCALVSPLASRSGESTFHDTFLHIYMGERTFIGTPLPDSVGNIIGQDEYEALLGGRIHPCAVFDRKGREWSNWHEDLADLEWPGGPYSPNWAEAHERFKLNLGLSGVTKNAAMLEYIREHSVKPLQIHQHEAARLLAEELGDEPGLDSVTRARGIVDAAAAGDRDAAMRIKLLFMKKKIGEPAWLP